jgi:membrane protein
MKLRSASRRSAAEELEAQHRPPPDEAPLDDVDDAQVGVTDLGVRDYIGIFKRAGRAAVDDEITGAAAAIAYYGFLAIPALLLISVGVFSVFAGPAAVDTIIERLGSVIPAEAVALLQTALLRTTEEGGGVTMIVVGGAVALWTASGAATPLALLFAAEVDAEAERARVRAAA